MIPKFGGKLKQTNFISLKNVGFFALIQFFQVNSNICKNLNQINLLSIDTDNNNTNPLNLIDEFRTEYIE